ncbi:MAG: DUF421 domain-containing protein [Ruminococcaceae bacterium]|nr:DUF421 domain-containing protein [Oscillospiraceae bacterium]
MSIIIARAFIFYFILTLMMKLMGKRQLGEMELSELVTTFLLSELAVYPITDPDIPLIHGLLPVLLISSLEVIISFACQRSKTLLKLLNGNPIVLYENGGYIDNNLIKTRVSTEDVETQVRINGFKGLEEIDKVILERTGKMSILPKGNQTSNQNGE